jgi:hypothetical protein
MVFWFFILKASAGAIVGQATNSWFKKTKMGVWFYGKIDQWYNWAAKRYNIKVLEAEVKEMEKFPALKKRIAEIEQKLNIK